MLEVNESVVAGETVRVASGGSGGTLVFLHGYTGWTPEGPFFDALAEDFHVVVPEMPGFGDSPRPSWVKEMEDLAFYYRMFIRDLGADGPVTLVGHSFGGWVAAETAVRFGGDLNALALMDPMGLRDEQHPVADIFVVPPDRLTKLEYERHEGVEIPDETSMHFIRSRSMIARMAWHPRLFNPRLQERLGFIDVPTLVLWGEHDRIVPPAHAKLFGESIPGATTTFVAESSHFPHLEQPDRSVRAIAEFIAGVRA